MNIDKIKQIIESILFAVGREVSLKELSTVLEIAPKDLENIIEEIKNEYESESRGIQIIKVEDSYQMCTKKENYEYIYQIIDKRNKPNLSQAALEILAIIAYNPRITRAEIESIRGVNSDGTMYKLLEHDLIEEAGRLDAPGRPTMYKTTKEFLRLFGYSTLEDLPELPRYKVDENQQIVIEDLFDEPNKQKTPMPEREENEEKQD